MDFSLLAHGIYQEYGPWSDSAERGWKFFMELGPVNVFLAGLLKLNSKRRGDAQRRHVGIRARMCGEDPSPGLTLGC